MIDILFTTYNRVEFTRAAWKALLDNTDWSLVREVVIHDDASTDGTREFLSTVECPAPLTIKRDRVGGPVAAMVCFLQSPRDIFAKVDNDTVVPPGWLPDCLALMDGVDLLGIEAFHPVAPCPAKRSTVEASHIGGIGLMRASAFKTLPIPDGRFGFTEWQHYNENVRKAWIDPALPVILLDHLPLDPWRTLSQRYVANGWQRPSEPYEPHQSQLWEWWTP